MKKFFVQILGIKGFSLVYLFILWLLSFPISALEERGREIIQELSPEITGLVIQSLISK